MHSTISNTLALLAIVGGVAAAAEMLPAKALPLSTILTGLEKAGLTMIVDANFDDGVWEVEGMRGNRAVEVHVDPLSGKILTEQPEHISSVPGAQAKTAAAIAKQLEDAGYAPILELDWERTYWEVEAISAQGHRKLHVDANSGKILSDRADD